MQITYRLMANHWGDIARGLAPKTEAAERAAAELHAEIWAQNVRVSADNPTGTHLRDEIHAEGNRSLSEKEYAGFESRGTSRMRGSGAFDTADLETQRLIPNIYADEDIFTWRAA